MASFMRLRLQITAHHGRGTTLRTFEILAACLIAPAASTAAPPEVIGSWILQCPNGPHPACSVRHQDRLFAKAGLSADLELRSVGDFLVPTVVIRGLPTDPLLALAARDRINVELQLPGQPATKLICVADTNAYVCAPADEKAASIAASFPNATSIGIRVTADGIGPTKTRSLAVTHTRDALARLRSAGAAAAPAPPPSMPAGLTRLLDKSLRAAGYSNGTADLPALMLRYLGR